MVSAFIPKEVKEETSSPSGIRINQDEAPWIPLWAPVLIAAQLLGVQHGKEASACP
jgi:hypothetical protein